MTDRLAALARGTLAVVLGAAILLAVGRWLGWYWVAATFLLAIGDLAYTVSRLPTRWRSW